MHIGHLVSLPGLASEWLTAWGAASATSIEVLTLHLLGDSTVLIGCHQELLKVHACWHHVEWCSALVLLPWASVHTRGRLLAVPMVHEGGLLLVVARERLQLLGVHVLERSLHSVLVEVAHLARSEIVHHSFVHVVWLLVMETKVSVHLLVE